MNQDFLGKGPSFPFRLDASGSRPAFASQEDLLRESIRMILITRIGERPYLVRNGIPFGTRIPDMLFEDPETVNDVVIYESKRAIEVWEPRVVLSNISTRIVQLRDNVAKVDVLLSYRVRATNRNDNFVVPFRLTRSEATI